ncbi:MAG: preprotein translocase subunit YajC [Coriobacteriia bacterium]|nr:preprotein translocase subunit YajC [Coriobacteriia bacterium]
MERYLPLLALLVAFWFLAIRPQQQRAKRQREMLDALAPGDRVVTIGGIYGEVVEAGERVLVRVSEGAEIEFRPSAIAEVLPGDVPDDDDDDAPEDDDDASDDDGSPDDAPDDAPEDDVS